jgi:hypothetical protein
VERSRSNFACTSATPNEVKGIPSPPCSLERSRSRLLVRLQKRLHAFRIVGGDDGQPSEFDQCMSVFFTMPSNPVWKRTAFS